MGDLILTPNIDRPDDFYAELIAAHEGLSKEESDALNARLILILANHIGDRTVLSAALAAAQLSQEEETECPD
jgi:predicted metalloendopeptidase